MDAHPVQEVSTLNNKYVVAFYFIMAQQRSDVKGGLILLFIVPDRKLSLIF
jgi:hypothetical protein